MTLPSFSLSRWRTRILPVPRFSGGPGEVSLAGTIADSRGTGRSRMRVFGQWALVYLVAGRGVYRDERGCREEVEAGRWILVFPEIAHSYEPAGKEKWHEIYVGFRGPVFEAWRQSGCFDPARPVGRWLPPAKGVRAFERFFRRIQRRDCTSLEAVCLWQNLLADILGPPPRPAEAHPDWLEMALDRLARSEPEPAGSLQKIARDCGLGYESFRKKFEQAVGVPPGRYVMERRMEHARRLMAMRHFTNKEIAELLGFCDEFHFSKAFSRFTGRTPREFRKDFASRAGAAGRRKA